jgi:hypothetical protein
VQRPDLIPAYVITEDSLELLPDADRYDSSSGTPSTGTETTLPLTKDRRPMLRWDSAGLAQAIGSDSLIEAFLDLTIVSNDGGWGGQGKQVGVYKIGTGWTETGGFLPPSECTPSWACPIPQIYPLPMDSLVFTNSTQGVVMFVVTSNVRNVLLSSSGDYVQGWMVRLRQETGSASVAFGSRESGTPPRLRLMVLRQTPAVPAEAPDTLPTDYYDSSKTRLGAACVSLRVHRDLITVTFNAGVTQAQRQAAIDLVGGQVAGGRRRGAGEGRYFVQIPFDQAGQNLCDAIDALNALPQVSSANFITYSEPLHRRPNDGPGWQRADWSLRREGITLTSRWGL